MSGIPEWLKVHRELQYLRSVASATKHDSRRKKKRKKRPGKQYVNERYKKLREVKE